MICECFRDNIIVKTILEFQMRNNKVNMKNLHCAREPDNVEIRNLVPAGL